MSNFKKHVSTINPVGAVLDVGSADEVQWSDASDVVVVGWGGAGASAAIEAREQGAEVLVIDRFSGGGASVLSGGVVYAGGGTRYQKEAGFEDSPEAMTAYLKHEVNGVVSDETLARFSRDSVANLNWLEKQGATFASTMPAYKTSYPTDGMYLYYSGNEVVPAYGNPQLVKKPAPRGHRVVAKGQSGATFFAALQKSTLAHGARTLTQARVQRLVREKDSGRVLGVEVMVLPEGDPRTERHKKLDELVAKWRLYQAPRAQAGRREAAQIESEIGEKRYIRARKGVVLSTGGYIFNSELLERHAPAYKPGWLTGAAGCDGSGLRLGQSVGGIAQDLNNISAWRFITPPSVWPKGLVVNTKGERFCNEQVYGAKLGYEMMEKQGGQAWLIIDSKLRRQAAWQCLFGGLWAFQSMPALALMYKVAIKGKSVADLAKKLRMDATVLQLQFDRANAAARGETEDPLGKSQDMRHEFKGGSLFAIDISISQKMFPLAVLSLGGLKVNEDNGAVIDGAGYDIPGLYAAGRTAIGVASSRYVSGLSLADCVFSGRRAGKAAALEGDESPAAQAVCPRASAVESVSS
ncbi:FAD-binding protein [Comamonas thiooxydans]|uniref:FAD-binding protein n=1 Tax=Comamonas thiooxydans TaxID=363952 RepID=UPI0005F7C513|nr:FAD-binding protein [Comamonas thiooxydans]CUA99909.1 Succinate dehydrogenase/fumarate reductase, flavoprotein subunit [Comamonas thiooxydans]